MYYGLARVSNFLSFTKGVDVAWMESVFTVREDELTTMACCVEVPSDILCRDIELFVSTADSTMSPQATSET